MDQREPPRTPPTEGRPREPVAANATPTAPRRFPRLVPPPAVRRLPPDRLALGAVGAFVGAALLWALVASVAQRVVSYVNGHPAYRLGYREVVLDPPPPAWFRGGSAAFLDRVFASPMVPKEFSALDVDKGRLRQAFRRNPWVQDVPRAEVVGPDRVRVGLVYREPVAFAGARPESAEAVIDGEAVLLPRDEVDFERAGPLVRLYRYDPPSDPRPGEVWNRVDPQTGALAPEPRVQAAARLAAFLRDRLRSEVNAPSAWKTVVIHSWGLSGTAVQVGGNLMFRWEEPARPASPSPPPEPARWEMMRDWVNRHPPEEGAPVLELRFTREGVVPQEPLQRPRASRTPPLTKSLRATGFPGKAERRVSR